MKTVCVIGLGPAGLTSVKELRAHGLDVTAYDPSSKIGGRWSLDWSASKHGVWKEMCLNDPRTFIEFSDFPWKKEDFEGIEGVGEDLHGLFAHATEAQLYLQAYADKFDLGSSFKLNTRVTKIEREGEGWRVYTTSNGYESFKSFDGIIHCVGRYSVPHNPLISEDGSAVLDNFSGEVIHSAEFQSAESMDAKRVLVIGHTVSGADVTSAIAIRGKAAKVVNSVRNVPIMFNRISRATNQVAYVGGLLGNRFTVWLSRTLPESLNMKGMRAQAIELFPEQITEEMTGNPALVANPDIMKSGASYAVDYIERLKAGLFTLKPGIESVEGNTVTFKDGSSEDFDIVICGTGYHTDLSLVPEDIKSKVMYESPVTGKRQPALYKWTLVPGEPTFAFSGQHSGIGPNWPAIEMASRFVAKVFAGDIPRPSEDKIDAGAKAFRQFRDERNPLHQQDLCMLVQELLAEEVGVAPSKVDAIWNARKLLFSYPYSSYYRTDPTKDDPEVVEKAKERFEWVLAHPDTYPVDA
jgi:dimethylaniline monooxygenase (N-oxide forming)